MLDRIGDEVARATTIVRFAPNSRFDAHTHGGGEEFFVLDGVFSDESGDFPAGAYVRNPIGTSHKPHTDQGCTILVKLHQFLPEDQDQKHIDTAQASFQPGPAPGVTMLPLHNTEQETVRLARFAPGTQLVKHAPKGGQEIFVVEGELRDEHGVYPAGTWIRNPDGAAHSPSSPQGCLILVKTGHLAAVVGA